MNGRLTLLLVATAENQPLWVHRGKVLCGLKAQTNIGPYEDDSLACKVNGFYWYLPPLLSDEVEKTEFCHDVGQSVTLGVTGDFTTKGFD